MLRARRALAIALSGSLASCSPPAPSSPEPPPVAVATAAEQRPVPAEQADGPPTLREAAPLFTASTSEIDYPAQSTSVSVGRGVLSIVEPRGAGQKGACPRANKAGGSCQLVALAPWSEGPKLAPTTAGAPYATGAFSRPVAASIGAFVAVFPGREGAHVLRGGEGLRLDQVDERGQVSAVLDTKAQLRLVGVVESRADRYVIGEAEGGELVVAAIERGALGQLRPLGVVRERGRKGEGAKALPTLVGAPSFAPLIAKDGALLDEIVVVMSTMKATPGAASKRGEQVWSVGQSAVKIGPKGVVATREIAGAKKALEGRPELLVQPGEVIVDGASFDLSLTQKKAAPSGFRRRGVAEPPQLQLRGPQPQEALGLSYDAATAQGIVLAREGERRLVRKVSARGAPIDEPAQLAISFTPWTGGRWAARAQDGWWLLEQGGEAAVRWSPEATTRVQLPTQKLAATHALVGLVTIGERAAAVFHERATGRYVVARPGEAKGGVAEVAPEAVGGGPPGRHLALVDVGDGVAALRQTADGRPFVARLGASKGPPGELFDRASPWRLLFVQVHNDTALVTDEAGLAVGTWLATGRRTPLPFSMAEAGEGLRASQRTAGPLLLPEALLFTGQASLPVEAGPVAGALASCPHVVATGQRRAVAVCVEAGELVGARLVSRELTY